MLPDDYWVVLVGDMITEEALPTYMAMLNTLDGVRDETGAAQVSHYLACKISFLRHISCTTLIIELTSFCQLLPACVEVSVGKHLLSWWQQTRGVGQSCLSQSTYLALL